MRVLLLALGLMVCGALPSAASDFWLKELEGYAGCKVLFDGPTMVIKRDKYGSMIFVEGKCPKKIDAEPASKVWTMKYFRFDGKVVRGYTSTWGDGKRRKIVIRRSHKAFGRNGGPYMAFIKTYSD